MHFLPDPDMTNLEWRYEGASPSRCAVLMPYCVKHALHCTALASDQHKVTMRSSFAF